MAGAEPIAGDPRFFQRAGPFALAALAEAAGAPVPVDRAGAGQGARMFTGIAPLQTAGPAQVSFLDNKRYLPALAESRAGTVLIAPELADKVPEACLALVTKDPYLAWARIAALFHPLPPVRPGIHRLACVDPAATVDPSVEIAPFAVIEAGAEIGPGCRIGPHAVIGAGVVLGADCRVGAHASLSHTLAGDRVVLYPGARVGQDGFGFTLGPAGFVAVPQLGRVILGDDVEVGANSTIDRGSAQDTVIGAGSRIDNLVQIGHNCHLGRCCVLVGQSGVAGSTILEDFVTLAGQAGIAGHLRIGKGARVGAQAGVMADLAGGADYLGSPALPVRDFFRQTAAMRRLAARPRPRAGDGPADRTDKADEAGEADTD